MNVRLLGAVLAGALLVAGGAAVASASAGHHAFGRGTGGCPVFPASNPWHENVSKLPGEPALERSTSPSIGADLDLHPGLRLEPDLRHPLRGRAARPSRKVADPLHRLRRPVGPGAVPDPAGRAGRGRRRARAVTATCSSCRPAPASSTSSTTPTRTPTARGTPGSGAVFNLRSNQLRPDGWTSADAAGLPIFAGLIRYDEIQRGFINHAIRFTAPQTQAGFIHPATHFASSSTESRPAADGPAPAPARRASTSRTSRASRGSSCGR